jgi:5-methylcytosine-specific restriction enzyme A
MRPDRSIMPEREPVEIAKRKPLTRKQRAEFFETHKGECYICKQKIKAGEPWDDEHPIDLWTSGNDNLADRRPAHRLDCHQQKTAADATKRAKTKRLIARETGTRRVRKAIPSAGFSDRSRGFDGQVKLTRKAERYINANDRNDHE